MSGHEQSRSHWPDPGKPFGAFFYAVGAGVLIWFAFEVLPHHLVVSWH